MIGSACLALIIAGNISRNYYTYKSVGASPAFNYLGIGIWQTCTGSTLYNQMDDCKSITDASSLLKLDSKQQDKIKTAQAFAIIGAIATAAAIAASFMEQKKMVTASLFFLAALSGLITLAVTAKGHLFDEATGKLLEFGAAFGISTQFS